MPGDLIGLSADTSAETIAWLVLAAMSAYFIAHYGYALRRRSNGSTTPARGIVAMETMKDARLVYGAITALLGATLLWVLNPMNFGAALAGLAAQIPALWTGFTVFITSLSNASGFTHFPPTWVLGLALAAGIVAHLLRTIEFETGAGGD